MRYAFIGPSLRARTARDIVGDGVQLLGPAKAGDLTRLRLRSGDAVALVDGLFYVQRSVRHREILEAVDRGASIVGAASLGALRAAEMPQHMTAVGSVARDFRAGRLNGDDEVAILHASAEEDYRPLSYALCNVRETLAGEKEYGLSPADKVRLLDMLSERPFYQRTDWLLYEVQEQLGIADQALRELISDLNDRDNTLKARDARRALEWVATVNVADRAVAESETRSFYLTSWELSLGLEYWPGFASTGWQLINLARFALDDVADVFARFASRFLAGTQGSVSTLSGPESGRRELASERHSSLPADFLLALEQDLAQLGDGERGGPIAGGAADSSAVDLLSASRSLTWHRAWLAYVLSEPAFVALVEELLRDPAAQTAAVRQGIRQLETSADPGGWARSRGLRGAGSARSVAAQLYGVAQRRELLRPVGAEES